MSELILRRLEMKDEATFRKALTEWDKSPDFHFERHFEEGMTFFEYLELLKSNERGEKLNPGYVPDTSLYAFLDSELIGRVSLRHSLTEFLMKFGGHIGYGVLPRFRQRGFAKKMLKLSLPYAKDLGLTRVLVTCDDDNIGSIKTIERNGGVLENKVVIQEGQTLRRRYWIEL